MWWLAYDEGNDSRRMMLAESNHELAPEKERVRADGLGKWWIILTELDLEMSIISVPRDGLP